MKESDEDDDDDVDQDPNDDAALSGDAPTNVEPQPPPAVSWNEFRCVGVLTNTAQTRVRFGEKHCHLASWQSV